MSPSLAGARSLRPSSFAPSAAAVRARTSACPYSRSRPSHISRLHGGRSADGRQSRTAPGRGSSDASGIVRGALGLGLRGVRRVGGALGLASAHAALRKPARELAMAAIVLLEAAPCLASSPWHLPKPSHHNAIVGRHCARSRIAQRIQDLFRSVLGLVRSVRDQDRPGAGAFRSRRYQFRCRPGQFRFGVAVSGAEWPSSCAVGLSPVRVWAIPQRT